MTTHERWLLRAPRASQRPPFLRGGYTVVEMLVSAAVFAVIVSIAVGAFVYSFRTERMALAVMETNDATSLILEQMAREMRLGFNFVISSGGDTLEFRDQNNQLITYKRQVTRIMRRVERPGPPRTEVQRPLPMTGPQVRITRLAFQNLASQPEHPNRITILLGVGSNSRLLTGVVVNIQTTVTARE